MNQHQEELHQQKMEVTKAWTDAICWAAFWIALGAVLVACLFNGWKPWETL